MQARRRSERRAEGGGRRVVSPGTPPPTPPRGTFPSFSLTAASGFRVHTTPNPGVRAPLSQAVGPTPLSRSGRFVFVYLANLTYAK